MKSKLVTIFGSQLGSEGKGALAAYLAQRSKFHHAVRVGGPNAGHTFYYPNGRKDKVQSVPVAAMLGHGCVGVIGPAGVILPDLLLAELQRGYAANGVTVSLVIDRFAAIIEPRHMDAEVEMKKSIGSTGEGVGAATADKVMRRAKTAETWDLMRWLKSKDPQATAGTSVAADTATLLNAALSIGHSTVMLEGTQGYGLSLHTGGFYPFCTSRECSPQAVWAETGANPSNADIVETIAVVRTFPIRVGGNSGILLNEITWETLQKETGGYVREPERTTVTNKIRRIARLDWELLERMVLQCRPTALSIQFLDYVFPSVAGVTDASALDAPQWAYIKQFEDRLKVPVKWVGTGPNSIVPLRVTL